MTIFVALLVTVLAFAFVVYPFFRRRSSSVDAVDDDSLRELYSKRDTTYSFLKEVEFDLQSGMLTDEEHRDLEATYQRKAISILRDIDNLEKGTEVEQEIEKQVQKLRRVRRSPVDEEVEKEVLELRRGKGQFCSQCGARCQEDDRFCSRCGTSLDSRRTS